MKLLAVLLALALAAAVSLVVLWACFVVGIWLATHDVGLALTRAVTGTGFLVMLAMGRRALQLLAGTLRETVETEMGHYSRQSVGCGRIGPPGRCLVLVTPCERATWLTHWTDYPDDGLEAWRCSIFRNEGAGRSSDLIRAAMALTEQEWGEAPDGWVTWVDPRKVASPNPGYCFKRAGWRLDRTYRHPRLLRFRA